jgi:bacterioferritin
LLQLPEGRITVDTKQLLTTLNRMYSLELNQVDLYSAQSKQVPDIYLRQTLKRVAEVEQGHVENISQKIIELGGKPTALGEAIAPVTGKVAGFLTGKAGAIALLKANIDLEEKAMKDYKDFLLKVGGDESFFNLLFSNLIDEDLHTAWFVNKVKELESISSG